MEVKTAVYTVYKELAERIKSDQQESKNMNNSDKDHIYGRDQENIDFDPHHDVEEIKWYQRKYNNTVAENVDSKPVIKNIGDYSNAAQAIIDKELNDPSRNHPDGFPGEDYPHDFTDHLMFDPSHNIGESLPKEVNYPPLVTEEEDKLIKDFYKTHNFKATTEMVDADSLGSYTYDSGDAWIQTYSGRRFTPTNPNPDSVVIQDIAHSLSMQCRFGGHSKVFYSVAQHCVLVSYVCNFEDALWGLMHDASEAYLVDVPRPIKRSGKFDAYIEFEDKVQSANCKRFNLLGKEPPSVKKADTILLATEARDLLVNIRSDWKLEESPLPFKIEPLGPRQAKDLFMKRFFELSNMPGAYEHYLHYENLK